MTLIGSLVLFILGSIASILCLVSGNIVYGVITALVAIGSVVGFCRLLLQDPNTK